MDRVFAAALSVTALLYLAAAKGGERAIPRTRFTCQGRAPGYYADVDTGCQVYHMCDGMGRQFSHACPNTTLFQQRMLVCDHWYMVDCAQSEGNYYANLLIGQRDKPFVTDDEMHLRTPRPDILSVPLNNNYYDGLKAAESKYSLTQTNSISDDDDTIVTSSSNNDLDRDKHNFNHKPSSSSFDSKPISNSLNSKPILNNFNSNPSTDNSNPSGNNFNTSGHNFNPSSGASNLDNPRDSNFRATTPNYPRTAPDVPSYNNINGLVPPNDDNVEQESSTRRVAHIPNVAVPSRELSPPVLPTTTTAATSEEFQIDVRMKPAADPVVKFINRFDPNSPDSLNTSMTRNEIININKHLPVGQPGSEEERTPRKNKNFGNSFNNVQTDKKKGAPENSRADTINTKSNAEGEDVFGNDPNAPSRELLPPKFDVTPLVTTTMGPPIYYEWKWAVPALDLKPPKISNVTYVNTTEPERIERPRYRPRSTTEEPDLKTQNVEYNISSYFVPDYVFPLDGSHPGYEGDHAQTSFQVEISRPGRSSFGENPACPHCHPAYLDPGSCEPCVVQR
ncbi:probable serine/threonine-protein kinase DDB_G0276461 [Aricia agestis]|uniref:probable serine/threonine-protein kinase DDB_G0276461 n=1 Tax=Aricia agestis TaxID=91739 RepID=UPI001C206A0F|nr:probable serine/threonine-protein kinase DDB_G0276461 [Aricia agestis]XP_041979875.1 probable serine/threonine-protein kinase DDB_G0276461 [Aricia agestis]